MEKRDKSSLKPLVKCEAVKILTDDPTDFEFLYPIINHEVQNIMEIHGYEDNDYYISITSGTPTMQFIWILLKQHGLIKAKLLRSIEERHQALHSGKPFIEVNLNLDDFPTIKSPGAVKRELTIVSRSKEKLSRELRIKRLNEQVPSLIGQSNAIMEIKEQILEEIDSKVHVLILGERGTGKQIVAQEIWRHHRRDKDNELMTFDCGTIAQTLLLSELFGHKKGAYTGANSDKKGLLETCHKRMLFLDEIGNLPLEGQNALLRYIQFSEYRRVGDLVVRKADTQVLAATNKDISDSSKFAQDLKDRFQEVIFLPPLRKRKEDIPELVSYFCRVHGKNSTLMVSFDLMDKLMDYDWHGNVRELETFIGKLSRRFGNRMIMLKDLPQRFTDFLLEHETAQQRPSYPDFPVNLKKYIEEIENLAIEAAAHNLAQADRLLGYSVGTLKQRKYNKSKLGKMIRDSS